MTIAKLPNSQLDDYARHHFLESIGQVRFAFLIGAPLYLAFLIWDYSLDPLHIVETFYIRVAVAMLLVTAYMLSYEEFFERFSQPVIAFCALMAGCGLVLVLYILDNGMTRGIAGLVLIQMYIYGFLHLRFRLAMISGLLIWLAYNIFAVIDQTSLGELINSNFFLAGATLLGISNSYNQERLSRQAFAYHEEMEQEKSRSDELLSQIFPSHIKNRLTAGERVIADSNNDVTVLFSDLVGFSSLTKRLSPQDLIEFLDRLFSIFDEISEKYTVEKIKTIGDSYMAVSGLVGSVAHDSETILDMALDLVTAVEQIAQSTGIAVGVRIGIATGHAVSGVLGSKRNHFDVWGETVNIASRMESSGIEGRVQVSAETYRRNRENFEFEERGEIEIKGHGKLNTYLLIRRRPAPTKPVPDDIT